MDNEIKIEKQKHEINLKKRNTNNHEIITTQSMLSACALANNAIKTSRLFE